MVVKKKGKVSELYKHSGVGDIIGNIGIAHTRWATHGEPNEINAHPHLDCKNEIAIVHNGIIENYQQLKKELQKENHEIKSETDSEIVAHLVEKFYKGDLKEAVINALKKVEGAFALVIIHKKENKVVAARRGSPLAIGVGKGEMFISSDAAAMVSHTKNVVYLDDDEVAEISSNGFSTVDFSGKAVKKEIVQLKWSPEQVEKGGYKHFMQKEIFEQPGSLNDTLRGRISKNGKIDLGINLNAKSIKRIIITACGTSWHSALIGKQIIERNTGIPVEVDYASEFRYRDPIVKKGDLAVIISQSGETADSLAALREAKSKRAKTLGMVNVVGSTIAREADSSIYLNAGPEIGVASTKAFISQVALLALLSLYLKQHKGLPANDDSFIREAYALPEKIKEVLKQSENIKKIASQFKESKNFIYLGRGMNFPVALEAALKLKEVSYIHAEGYPAAEMKHGPIALVDENMPVVFICSKDRTYEKILSNMEEIKARRGRIIAIANEEDDRINKLAEKVFIVPKTHEDLLPIINVIPLQLLAYYMADMKNIDVDKPRNLAKSVTVE